MNGQVPETQTYQTWLKKQSFEFQNDVLGKSRAEMFRNDMPLDRFVDDSGKTYTLAELKAKEGVKSATDKTTMPKTMEQNSRKTLNEFD